MTNLIVADDEILLRRAYADIFEDIGYNVITFENGNALLKALPELQPDAIILDVQMPGLDGISVCKEIRKRPGGRNIPIIIISGSCGRSEPDLLSSQADRFIHKPVDTDVLIATVEAVISQESRPVVTK